MRVLFSIILVSAFSSAECGVNFEKQPDDHIYTEEGQDRTIVWTYSLTAPHDGKFNVLNFIKKNSTDEVVATNNGALPSYVGKIEVTEPANFTIKNFNKNDVAEYFIVVKCFGLPDVLSPKTVFLRLKEMAKVELNLPLQVKRHDLLILGEGTKATLQCTATGGPPPNITWYKELKNDRIEVKNKNGIKIETEGFSSNLTITNATYEDNANYLCVGKNFGNESVVGSFLAVPFIDVPEHTKKYFSKTKDGTIVLTCPVIGFPTPVYEWFVEGKKAKETSRKWKVSSRGNYTCYGSNLGGKTSFNFSVEDGLEMTCDNSPIVKWRSPGVVQRYLVSYISLGENVIVQIGVFTGKTTEFEIPNDDSSTGQRLFNVTVEAIMSDNAVLEGKCLNF